jgi:tRNA U34 5-methylaminomethyl-2-thiouridine-forming methyltransferase MnmC
MYKTELITTADGSHTLYIPAMDEHYHSRYGAVAEGLHVYVEAGYEYSSGIFETISLLEVGFGTGLNSLLTLMRCDATGRSLRYTGLDPFPPEPEVCAGMNYPDCVPGIGAEIWWDRIHREAAWMSPALLTERVSLLKWRGYVNDYPGGNAPFHVVYFDAFGPDVAPEMWTPAVFSHLATLMSTGGVLVTYSSKGAVRRALTEAGFSVEKIPGFGGKREMVRAIKR